MTTSQISWNKLEWTPLASVGLACSWVGYILSLPFFPLSPSSSSSLSPSNFALHLYFGSLAYSRHILSSADGGIERVTDKVQHWFQEKLANAPATVEEEVGLKEMRLAILTPPDTTISPETAKALAQVTQVRLSLCFFFLGADNLNYSSSHFSSPFSHLLFSLLFLPSRCFLLFRLLSWVVVLWWYHKTLAFWTTTYFWATCCSKRHPTTKSLPP